MLYYDMNLKFLLIMFLANGLIGALVGQKKNRIEAGLLFGFLLGPLGWLLVALGPNHGPKCPECGGDIVENARRCKNCGVELHTIESQIDSMDFPDSPFGDKDSK